jgi:hypothetical protein
VLTAPNRRSPQGTAVERARPERAHKAALSHARLSATIEARLAAVPTDPTLEVVEVNKQLRQVRQLRTDLEEGRGVWANTEAGRAGRDLTEARRRATRSSRMAEAARGWRERRSHRKEAAAWTKREAQALGRWRAYGQPEADRIDCRVRLTQIESGPCHTPAFWTQTTLRFPPLSTAHTSVWFGVPN